MRMVWLGLLIFECFFIILHFASATCISRIVLFVLLISCCPSCCTLSPFSGSRCTTDFLFFFINFPLELLEGIETFPLTVFVFLLITLVWKNEVVFGVLCYSFFLNPWNTKSRYCNYLFHKRRLCPSHSIMLEVYIYTCEVIPFSAKVAKYILLTFIMEFYTFNATVSVIDMNSFY